MFKSVTTPLWDKCEGEAHIPKSGKLESSGTPENSELDCRGQNTSHWGVFDVIGKALKCRCPKWPRMSHLDIYSPSYGQTKSGIDLISTSADSVRHGVRKLSKIELQDCFRPHPNRRSKQKVMDAQSPGSANRDNFGTPLWESRKKVPFACSLGGEL